VLLGLVLAAFFRWISAGASTWLDVAATHFSPRQTYRIGLAVGSSILAVWLSVLFELYGLVRWTGAILADPDYWEQVQTKLMATTDLRDFQSAPVMGVILVSFALVPTVTLLTAWLFPLAPWLWRELGVPAIPTTGWYLEPSAGPLQPALRAPLRVDRAVRLGIIGGAIACAVLLLVAFGFFLSAILLRFVNLTGSAVPRPSWSEGWADLAILWLNVGEWLFGFALLASIAALVMRGVRRLHMLHALCATSISAAIMLGGVLATYALLGVLPDLPITLTIIALVSIGVLASCLAGSAVSALMGSVQQVLSLAALRRTVVRTPITQHLLD
jgi:hypothetical protein